MTNKRKNFIKVPEDFTCQNCGLDVKGTGYTNHCPSCLYSLHVDKNIPGDRLSACGGLMEPLEVEIKRGEYIILHRCRLCGKKSRNKSSPQDNFEVILDLVRAKAFKMV